MERVGRKGVEMGRGGARVGEREGSGKGGREVMEMGIGSSGRVISSFELWPT
jgi:hypothetical protein